MQSTALVVILLSLSSAIAQPIGVRPGSNGPGGAKPPSSGAPAPSAAGATPTSTTACPQGNGQDVRLVSTTSTEYTVFFSGCPFYSPHNETTPNTPSYQNKTVTFRKIPVISSTVTYVGLYASGSTTNTKKLMGTIGYTVTGIALFSEADADGRDAYVYEGPTFDGCRGHAEMNGVYHYHSEPGPGCVYSETAGKHSPLLGIMFDNVPIYGALGDNGVAPTDLDECGGHTDATYPFYHYHTTYNLKAPYLVKCFRGCIFNANGNPSVNAYSLVKTDATCVKASQQYDYSTFVNPLLTVSPSPAGGAQPPPPNMLPQPPPTSKPALSPPTSKPALSPPTSTPVLSPPTARPAPSTPAAKPAPSPPAAKPAPSPPAAKPAPSPPAAKPAPSPPAAKPAKSG